MRVTLCVRCVCVCSVCALGGGEGGVSERGGEGGAGTEADRFSSAKRASQGSLSVTLGRVPSATCYFQRCLGFTAHWPACSKWAGFFPPVNHSLVLRFSNCAPEMCRDCWRGAAFWSEGRLKFLSLLHVGLPGKILFGKHKRVPPRNNSNTIMKITQYLQISGLQELCDNVFLWGWRLLSRF